MSDVMNEVLTLRTNLAEYPQTMAIRDGRVTSEIVKLDICGPDQAHNGFKDMLRKGAYDAGELAIVTYLQAKCYGKPFVALPAPISGRFQHHCAGFNKELGWLDPKDIEGKQVGVRTYAQTTGLWVRGILQHECGVDLDKVTWMTVGDGHLEEYTDPSNCVRLPKGSDIGQMMLDGKLAATLQGSTCPRIRACNGWCPIRSKRPSAGTPANRSCRSTTCSWSMRTFRRPGPTWCARSIA